MSKIKQFIKDLKARIYSARLERCAKDMGETTRGGLSEVAYALDQLAKAGYEDKKGS